jgi:hypothetical protein
LGGAVALYGADQYKELGFRGVIIENSFTSMSEIVDKVFRIAKYVKWLILRNHWNSLERVKKL